MRDTDNVDFSKYNVITFHVQWYKRSNLIERYFYYGTVYYIVALKL